MKIFGTLHGVAFLAVTIVAAVVQRWKCWIALQAVLAAIPPLVSIPLERWLARHDHLARYQP